MARSGQGQLSESVTIRLDARQMERLRKKAIAENVEHSAIIRTALDLHLAGMFDPTVVAEAFARPANISWPPAEVRAIGGAPIAVLPIES